MFRLIANHDFKFFHVERAVVVSVSRLKINMQRVEILVDSQGLASVLIDRVEPFGCHRFNHLDFRKGQFTVLIADYEGDTEFTYHITKSLQLV